MSSGAGARAAVAAVALAVVVAPFFAATTFVGDDHLFLAFARYAPNPLAAFVRDLHGGEYYRPLPMLLWWVLARAGGASPAPFAALGLALHGAAAAVLAALVRALGRPRAAAALAGALFLVAPQNLEAAYWYAASTDLLAAVFTLGALLALVRGGAVVSALLALAAYLSKESALVLPGLAMLVVGARAAPDRPALRWWGRLQAVAPHLALAVAVVVVRVRVLKGWGGAGDDRAGPLAKLVQTMSGLVHVGTGAAVLPDGLAWALGVCAIALLVFVGARRARAGERGALAPLAFVVLSAAPLAAAGWAVGARYFYLPAAGLAWAAGEALAAAGAPAQVVIVTALLAVGGMQAIARRADVQSYEARVAAARRAVAAGVADGHRVFHIASGVKDLDLAVKEANADRRLEQALVLTDVPASFAIVPPDIRDRAAFLIASPPLPPAGAYRFGDQEVVGLARRGDDPTLDEVTARFPDVRFVRLRPGPGGRVLARDVTAEILSPPD
jgi:hypothetical protein